MDIYKINWTPIEHSLFSLLCLRAGERLSQREIAKILDVSPTAIANSIKRLKDFVTVENVKIINFVSLNRENQLAVELKRTENIRNIYLSGLSGYLSDELSGSTIILFGSYSRGEDTFGSDIDIAVIERKNKKLDTDKFAKVLNRKINIQFYNSFKEIGQHLKNNILNGIVLHGSVEL